MSYPENRIILFIRSLLFTILSNVLIVVCSLGCLFLLPFSLELRHRYIRFFLRWYVYTLKVTCHIDYQVDGLENMTPNRNGIILCKHQSAWEAFYLPIIFNDPAIIVKHELLWIPFFGWGLSMSDPISINRKAKTSAMQQIITKGKKCLDDGRWILIFPEGTRIPYGKVGKYHLGGARLATATGYPVIPIAHNAGRYWAKRQFIKQPGTIHMMIGPMIETTGRTADEVMLQAKTWIEDAVERIDRLAD